MRAFAHRRVPLVATATAVAAATGWATTARRLHHRTRQLNTAQRDGVTGLLTRTTWEQAARSRWNRHDSVLGLLDLDEFKRLNDQLGHPAGDVVLRTVASRMTRTLGRTGLLGRWGGDELVVLLGQHAAEHHLPALHSELARPIPLGSVELRVGVSLGLSTPGCPDLDTALAEADRQMYQAKHQRKLTKGASWL